MTEQPKKSPNRWYAYAVEELGHELRVVLTEGLAGAEAARRLSAHGPNELPEAPLPSPWSILGAQFTSLIVCVLIGAAIDLVRRGQVGATIQYVVTGDAP